MSNIINKLIETPYGDPYWNVEGMLNGKRVVGHQMTESEAKEYESMLVCFTPWHYDFDKHICWRYDGE